MMSHMSKPFWTPVVGGVLIAVAGAHAGRTIRGS